MNEEEWIRKLAARARMETPPQVDVAARVLTALHSKRQEQTADEKPFLWVGAFAIASAVAIAIQAFSALDAWINPVWEILSAMTWGML